MEYFAFLHGSVLLCSTHCSWLGVCAAPAGTHPLSSWERISLDSRIGEMLSHTEGLGGSGLVCAGTSPQTPSSSDTDCSEDQRGVSPIQAVCLTHIFLDMDQSFQNLPDTEPGGGWAQHIRLRLTPHQGLLQSHRVHLAGRKRGYRTCNSIFKLSMGLMCRCQEVPGGRHNSSN